MNWPEAMHWAIYYNKRLGYKAYRVRAFKSKSGQWFYGMVAVRRG